jgi:hypothetical protein
LAVLTAPLISGKGQIFSLAFSVVRNNSAVQRPAMKAVLAKAANDSVARKIDNADSNVET